MKDNQHEQLFTELTPGFEATPAFQELDDEVAATCSGGAAPVTLYEDTYLSGDRHDIFGNDRDLRNGPFQGFNDRTSSIIIREGKWELFSDKEYSQGTGSRKNPLGPGVYNTARDFGLANDSLSSIRRVPGT
ncbi:beta/gamma crystallin-related protein [Tolypothrix bouteillei VB521301_2]|uniref:Beta/gamma crystallin 'Greek key' domain-containing protein n=1 Tax=Tolypothrix bouteillei VB521301 TaxID=1479485 RepID=A0A0C1R8W8_9CYAN